MLSGNVLHRPPCGPPIRKKGTWVDPPWPGDQSQPTIWPPTPSPSKGLPPTSTYIQGCNCPRQTDPWATREVKELRDGAVESPDQCGDACVLCLERIVAHPKWHGQSRWISQCVQESGGVSVENCATTGDTTSCLVQHRPIRFFIIQHGDYRPR